VILEVHLAADGVPHALRAAGADVLSARPHHLPRSQRCRRLLVSFTSLFGRCIVAVLLAGEKFRALLPAVLLGGALVLQPLAANAETRYVFATFLGDALSQEKLSIYLSTDGLTFTLLSNTGYGGPTGVLRDPSIMKHTDGRYYVAYTLQSWTTTSMSFGIASSSDLLDWTFFTEVPAGVTGAQDTWAPEWFKDTDGVHLLVNIDTSGTDSDFRTYDFRATDDTLTIWDPPVEMGIGPNYIDTFVVKSGTTYHAFSKNETTKYVEHATASTLDGPWTWVGTGDWAGWGSGLEGMALFQLDNGDWRMFLDCYNSCGFLYATSSDLTDFSGTMMLPGLSGVVRHGTVLREELDGPDGGSDAGTIRSPDQSGCACTLSGWNGCPQSLSALAGAVLALWSRGRRSRVCRRRARRL